MAITEITPGYMDEINTGLQAIFDEVFAKAHEEADYNKVATIIKSNNKSESYGWLGDLPTMREWVGDRVLNDINMYDYEIKHKKFEVTIEVDRTDIQFDNLGIIKPRVESMGTSVIYHYLQMVFGLLETNGNCYDGKAFFAADHSFGGTTYSNIGTAKLDQTTLLAARTNMQKIKSDTGRHMFINPNLLIVPPELEMKAREILVADLVDSGNSNLTRGIMDYIVCPHLTNADGWYLMDISKPVKPLVFQITQEPIFSALDDPKAERVFLKDKFLYGVDTKDNAGYGFWQFAYHSDGSAS